MFNYVYVGKRASLYSSRYIDAIYTYGGGGTAHVCKYAGIFMLTNDVRIDWYYYGKT